MNYQNGMGYNPYPQYGQYQNYGMQQVAQMPQMPQSQPNMELQQSYMSKSSRAVASREEAVSVPADFSGAPIVMTNLGQNVIYVKQWNMQTGSADFAEFVRKIPEQPVPVEYALKSDIDELREEIKAMKKPAKAVKRDDE